MRSVTSRTVTSAKRAAAAISTCSAAVAMSETAQPGAIRCALLNSVAAERDWLADHVAEVRLDGYQCIAPQDVEHLGGERMRLHVKHGIIEFVRVPNR